MSAALGIAIVLPYVRGGFQPRDSYYLEVMLQSSKEGATQVFFDRGRGFNEQDSITLHVATGTEPRLFRFELPADKCGAVRFDPIDREAELLLSIPRIVNSSGQVVRSFSFSDLLPSKQIDTMEAIGEMVALKTSSGANDPVLRILLSSPLDFQAKQRKSMAKTLAAAMIPAMLFAFACMAFVVTYRKDIEGLAEGSAWSVAPIAAAMFWVVLIGVFLALCRYAYPYADDYCIASISRQHGLWGGLRHFYLTWTGRYFSVGLALWHFMNPEFFFFYKVAAALLLVLFLASLHSFTWSLLRPFVPHRLILLTSAIVISTYVATMPSPFEGFYWLLGGGLFYQLGASLTLFLFSLIVPHGSPTGEDSRRHNSRIAARVFRAAVCSLLVAAIVGTTETNMVVLLALLFPAAALSTLRRDSRNTPELWLMLLIAVVCSAVVILAPGNSVRKSYIAASNLPTMQLWFTLRSAALAALSFFKPAGGQFLFLLPGALALIPTFVRAADKLAISTQIGIGKYLAFVAFWFSLLTASFIPAFYAIGSLPPPRTVNLIHLIFVVGWFVQFFLLVAMILQRYPHWLTLPEKVPNVALVLLIVFLAFFGNFRRCASDLLFKATEYRRQQIERYRVVAEEVKAGTDTVVLPAITVRPASLIHVDQNPGEVEVNYWVNCCMAQYYQVKAFMVQAPLQ